MPKLNESGEHQEPPKKTTEAKVAKTTEKIASEPSAMSASPSPINMPAWSRSRCAFIDTSYEVKMFYMMSKY